MCCIFTCCGWVIDLIQRLWTFTMSCCISSAVCCVMLTAAMSGIALGYNYSLAEYIDLKETNVSVYLKRGVFDDEVADDMDWRRSGRLPVAGHIGSDNLMTGAQEDDESTTLRSGRRLDDSVFEADDKNRYEGSLMKLTAKPVFEDTPSPQATADVEMAEHAAQHPKGSLDQMKAIQSLLDSRRAMATGGSTASPLATYSGIDPMLKFLPLNLNANMPGNPDAHIRRMMENPKGILPPMQNPARYAVPDTHIGQAENWLIPKKPSLFNPKLMPDYFVLSPTYPPAITVSPRIIRPTPPSTHPIPDGAIMFVTRTIATPPTKPSAIIEGLQKESDAFHEPLLLDNELPIKNEFIKMSKSGSGKSPEEEYEDEIKGLPVRKRRSVQNRKLIEKTINVATENNITHYGNSSSNNNIIAEAAEITFNKVNDRYDLKSENLIFTENNNSHIDVELTDKQNTDQEIKTNENQKPDQTRTSENTHVEHSDEQNREKSLLKHLIVITETKQSNLMSETTEETNIISTKKVIEKAKMKAFESKIVSSKYLPNRGTKIRQPIMDNADLLESVSVQLNEGRLLSKSSNLVKLLKSTLT